MLAASGLIGCGGGAIETGRTVSDIIGGSSDSADPSIVALFAHLPASQSGNLCTAEVISPTVLLTAAHCVDPAETGTGAEFDVLLSPTLPGNTAPIVAKETHFDTAFDTQNPQNGHDIGIVILSSPINLKPIPFNRTPLPQNAVQQNIRIVGYGLSDINNQATAGTKRSTTTVLNGVTPLLLNIGVTNDQTCRGDSGGPALMMINGVETIVGVTSYGNDTCTGGSFDTRVDLYTSFIDTYVKTGCVPMCTGKTCGADGCGGTCGTCTATQMCTVDGQCVEQAAQTGPMSSLPSGSGGIGAPVPAGNNQTAGSDGTPGASTGGTPSTRISPAPAQSSLTGGAVGGGGCTCLVPARDGGSGALMILGLGLGLGLRRRVRR